MLKKLKEFDSNYSNLFFCISLLIIIIFLAYFSVTNRDRVESCKIPNDTVNGYTNYSYNITYTKDDSVVKLFIKRHDSKYLIEKIEGDTKNTYYIHYTDILEKTSNGEYIRYRKDNILDTLDNKFLLLDYINDLSLESKITTEDELTCYINRKKEISMCINLDDSITLKANDYTIVYEITERGGVADFKVNINLDYQEDIDTNEVIGDSSVQ